jgi:hypothetical protein
MYARKALFLGILKGFWDVGKCFWVFSANKATLINDSITIIFTIFPIQLSQTLHPNNPEFLQSVSEITALGQTDLLGVERKCRFQQIRPTNLVQI